jgi:hypothetical protein
MRYLIKLEMKIVTLDKATALLKSNLKKIIMQGNPAPPEANPPALAKK